MSPRDGGFEKDEDKGLILESIKVPEDVRSVTRVTESKVTVSVGYLSISHLRLNEVRPSRDPTRLVATGDGSDRLSIRRNFGIRPRRSTLVSLNSFVEGIFGVLFWV